MMRILRDAMIGLTGSAVALAILGIGAMAFMSVVTVTVHNDSQQKLANLRIGFTGKTLWQGELDPQESKWTFGIPTQDGSVEVTYGTGNSPITAKCGYVTRGPLGGSFVVTVLPDGHSECEDKL